MIVMNILHFLSVQALSLLVEHDHIVVLRVDLEYVEKMLEEGKLVSAFSSSDTHQ